MAKSKDLPAFREKRKALFSDKVSPEKKQAAGKRFMEAGRFDDALEFFSRASAQQDVQRIARHAIEAGDAPLFLRAKVVLKEQPTEQELSALASAAEAAGRKSMASVAHAVAGHEQEAERLLAEALGTGEEQPQAPSEAPADDVEAQGTQ